jgi:tetratricopeptide (TPR) repeat protein
MDGVFGPGAAAAIILLLVLGGDDRIVRIGRGPAARSRASAAPPWSHPRLPGQTRGRRPSLERACELFAASAGERALSTATARSNLARVYVSLGRHTEAEALFTDVMAVFREEDAAPSNTAIAVNGLGLIRRKAGRYDEAIGLFEQALDLFARQPEIGSGDAVTVLRNLAAACEAKGDSTGARRAMQRALDLERRQADAAAGMG